MKKFNDIINESVDTSISIGLDFINDDIENIEDEDDIKQATEDAIENWIKEYLKDKNISFKLLDFSGAPFVEFTAETVSNMFDLLMVYSSDDEEKALDFITEELISDKRFKEAFDIIKEKDSNYFKHIDFPKEFIITLNDEDKSLLLSIKGIKKFDL
jgi:hypothetical protein